MDAELVVAAVTLEDDPEVGIDIALDQIEEIKDSGAFDGVHLVPVGRYHEVAERLKKA